MQGEAPPFTAWENSGYRNKIRKTAMVVSPASCLLWFFSALLLNLKWRAFAPKWSYVLGNLLGQQKQTKIFRTISFLFRHTPDILQMFLIHLYVIIAV